MTHSKKKSGKYYSIQRTEAHEEKLKLRKETRDKALKVKKIKKKKLEAGYLSGKLSSENRKKFNKSNKLPKDKLNLEMQLARKNNKI